MEEREAKIVAVKAKFEQEHGIKIDEPKGILK